MFSRTVVQVHAPVFPEEGQARRVAEVVGLPLGQAVLELLLPPPEQGCPVKDLVQDHGDHPQAAAATAGVVKGGQGRLQVSLQVSHHLPVVCVEEEAHRLVLVVLQGCLYVALEPEKR